MRDVSTPDAPTLSLGRRPDDYSRPKLDLTSLAATGDFSMVPAAADYISSLLGRWAMLGNDVAGDCEAVRWANHRLLMGAGYPTQEMVWSLYRTQNPDFDPAGDASTNGPGSAADQGMATDVTLDYLHKSGGPDGAKVVAFGTLSPANPVAVQRAIAMFGAVWLDILVQPGNMREFAHRAPWTNTGERAEGGHAVLGGGYSPGWLAVTWADVVELTDSFWTGLVPEGALVERVYLPIWPEHATKEFIASQGAQQLAADYQALTGRKLVWPDPPAPPGPPAPPAASVTLSDPHLVESVRQAAQTRKVSPEQWLADHLHGYFGLVDSDFDG